MKSVHVKEATGVNITHVSVGVDVPRTVTKYWEPVPESIVRIMPAWRSYKIVRVHDEFIIIDPASFRIVYVFD